MERFYGNYWEREMSKLDALREAQLWILNNPDQIRSLMSEEPKEKGRTLPCYWAAFTLNGDWQ